jgi:pimeloyl-ACP methyl ester carboxylesterase
MFKIHGAVAAVTLMAMASFANAQGSSSALAAGSEKPVSIVLVHGAFVDGSGWQKVYDLLTNDGYQVIVTQNSTASLNGDVATVQRALALARHPVVLVGHSYGGMIITQAGNNPKVRDLVYIAAFEPEVGESVSTWLSKPLPAGYGPVPVAPPQDGFLTVQIDKFPAAFAADVDPQVTRFMAASQVPWGKPAIETKITEAAWKTKPTYALVTTEDHMIPTPDQRQMVARSHAKVTEVTSSHAVMLSHPDKVASFIEGIAEGAE